MDGPLPIPTVNPEPLSDKERERLKAELNQIIDEAEDDITNGRLFDGPGTLAEGLRLLREGKLRRDMF